MSKQHFLVVISTLILFIFLFTACSGEQPEESKQISGNSEVIEVTEEEPTTKSIIRDGKLQYGGLVLLDREEFDDNWIYNQFIAYDPSTMVMYCIFISDVDGGNSVTITTMYNADGTPKLYNSEKNSSY